MTIVSKRLVGAVGGVCAAILILILPAPAGLDLTAQRVVAVIALAAIFWATDVLNAGITALLAIALILVAGAPSAVTLSGFSTGAFWMLVSVLFFGAAMNKTGLARRLAYQILLVFQPTYIGVLTSFLVIGFVLTIGVPSMTVRTAIMVPIAFALVKTLGLPLPSRGSALIILSAFEMAVLPGCALLTGSLWGPLIAGLYQNAGIPLEWIEWAKVLALPTFAWCVLLLVANFIVLQPLEAAVMTRDVIREETRNLGPLSRPELFTALIIGIAVMAWMLQPWHRVPAEAVGMLALAALFATGTLDAGDIGTGIPWALAIFVGGMLSLTALMSTFKINAWLGTLIVPAIQPFIDTPALLAVVLSVAVAATRFLDPVGFITIAIFFLPLAAMADAEGLPPLVLTALILLPLHVFWFNYQNIWVVMTEGLSQNVSYTGAHRSALATTFFVVTIFSLWLSIGYWNLIGVL